jgi:hypothetical protein
LIAAWHRRDRVILLVAAQVALAKKLEVAWCSSVRQPLVRCLLAPASGPNAPAPVSARPSSSPHIDSPSSLGEVLWNVRLLKYSSIEQFLQDVALVVRALPS